MLSHTSNPFEKLTQFPNEAGAGYSDYLQTIKSQVTKTDINAQDHATDHSSGKSAASSQQPPAPAIENDQQVKDVASSSVKETGLALESTEGTVAQNANSGVDPLAQKEKEPSPDKNSSTTSSISLNSDESQSLQINGTASNGTTQPSGIVSTHIVEKSDKPGNQPRARDEGSSISPASLNNDESQMLQANGPAANGTTQPTGASKPEEESDEDEDPFVHLDYKGNPIDANGAAKCKSAFFATDTSKAAVPKNLDSFRSLEFDKEWNEIFSIRTNVINVLGPTARFFRVSEFDKPIAEISNLAAQDVTDEKIYEILRSFQKTFNPANPGGKDHRRLKYLVARLEEDNPTLLEDYNQKFRI